MTKIDRIIELLEGIHGKISEGSYAELHTTKNMPFSISVEKKDFSSKVSIRRVDIESHMKEHYLRALSFVNRLYESRGVEVNEFYIIDPYVIYSSRILPVVNFMIKHYDIVKPFIKLLKSAPKLANGYVLDMKEWTEENYSKIINMLYQLRAQNILDFSCNNGERLVNIYRMDNENFLQGKWFEYACYIYLYRHFSEATILNSIKYRKGLISKEIDMLIIDGKDFFVVEAKGGSTVRNGHSQLVEHSRLLNIPLENCILLTLAEMQPDTQANGIKVINMALLKGDVENLAGG